MFSSCMDLSLSHSLQKKKKKALHIVDRGRGVCGVPGIKRKFFLAQRAARVGVGGRRERKHFKKSKGARKKGDVSTPGTVQAHA